MEKKVILQKGQGSFRRRQKLSYLYETEDRYVAQVPETLRDLAETELTELGATDVESLFRGIRFRATRKVFYRINYMSRLISRVLAPLIAFDCPDKDVLYKSAKTIRWEEFLSPKQTFSVYANVSDATITHSQYAGLRVKDAIADYFRDRTNRRPNVDSHDPDVGINLHIRHDQAHISIDTSGAPLHKRGYREQTVAAPMQETIAAGLVRLSGWDGSCPLYDPMCGSGTLLAEALMDFCRIPAGIFRNRFGFECLPDYDAALFEAVKAEAKAGIRPLPEQCIAGSDIAQTAVDAARTNLMGLHYGNRVGIEKMDFAQMPAMSNTVIITNPPYGIRLEKGKDLAGLYKALGDVFKQKCTGSTAFIYFGDPSLARHIGLKASWKKPVTLGGLKGVFARYELY